MSVIDPEGWELADPDTERLPRHGTRICQPRPTDPRRSRSAPPTLGRKINRTKVQHFDPAVMNRAFINGKTPETPLQALVEGGVEEPEESTLERELRVEPLRQAIEECLTERERFVIEAKFWRGLGLDLTAKQLGLSKTHVARIRDMALRKLRNHLGDEDGQDSASDGGPRAGAADDRGDRGDLPLPELRVRVADTVG